MSRQLPPRRPQAESEVIARLREIAEQSSGLSLIADDDAMSPDGVLLDHCAKALYLLSQAERARDASWIWRKDRGNYTPAMRAEDVRLSDEREAAIRQAKPILRLIGKIPARTAAGVYAKALVVRGSRTGAETLARSLAHDLVDIPGLRASLWPPGAVV